MKTITLEEHFTTAMYVEATAGIAFGGQPNSYTLNIQRKQADLGEGRIADMDDAEIDLQVLSLSGILLDALDADTAGQVVHDANDHAAHAVRAYPDRFAAFASLSLKQPNDAAEELKRCVNEFGFKGAIVNGLTDGLFLDDERFFPVLRTAQELGVPIYLHPAPPPKTVRDSYFSGLSSGYGQLLSIAGWGWHVETGLHALRLIVSGVFEKLPDLQIIIGHMGENLPFSIARADSVLSHAVRPLTKPAIETFQTNFHITTSGYFTLPPFECAKEVIGLDRILFSVDYPYSTNAQGRTFLNSLPITDEERSAVAGENAKKLLKL